MMMTMVCKSDSLKKTGFILSGLGLIFIGLSLMSDAMKVNRDAIHIITSCEPLAIRRRHCIPI